MTAARPPLVTARFALVVGAGLAYFLALAMLLPVIPRYVEGPLGGGSVAVGVAVGSFAVGAVLLRPFAGRVGDRTGRRVLIVGGALVVAASTACYGLVASMPWIVLARFVSGIGEAAFFVGAATMITDLAPVERRGEAVSYWSVAVYGGLAFGPLLGELVVGSTADGGGRWGAAWAISAALAGVAAALGAATVEVPRAAPTGPPPRLVHPAAVGPGVVLFLGLIGLAGFSAFVPLYVDELDLADAGPIFLVYGVFVLVVRIVGARLPDRVGPMRSATAALALGGAGTAVMATWVAVPGLVAGTIVFAAGMSLMYPALLLLSLTGVPDGERAAVVGTFSSFFDLSQGIGALLCGVVVALSGDRGAFATGAVCAAIGLLVLRRSASLRARSSAPVT